MWWYFLDAACHENCTRASCVWRDHHSPWLNGIWNVAPNALQVKSDFLSNVTYSAMTNKI